MLTDIYARSLLTAARQDCVRLRDLPPAAPLPRPVSPSARLWHWLQRTRRQPRCADLQRI